MITIINSQKKIGNTHCYKQRKKEKRKREIHIGNHSA